MITLALKFDHLGFQDRFAVSIAIDISSLKCETSGIDAALLVEISWDLPNRKTKNPISDMVSIDSSC